MPYIYGLPNNISEFEEKIFISRINTAWNDLEKNIGKEKANKVYVSSKEIQENVSCSNSNKRNFTEEKDENEGRCLIDAIEPRYSFSQLILADDIKDKIIRAVKLIELEKKIFDDWGLREIEPFPRSALNFSGPPGTGKTMAAHAIANFLHTKIMLASYAEIESKYHGDGPKNVKALFKKAEENDALLFIDEADSLLSKRLSNVTQGSEQAINSMRSQLLINLEQFHGIVIFSTNFVENYDKAFETRVRNIEFRMPDAKERAEIWKIHLPSKLPLANAIDYEKLGSDIDDICGRDIKNAVIDSALKAALANRSVTLNDLIDSINEIKKNRIADNSKKEIGTPLSEEEKEKIEIQLKEHFNNS
jgi:ATP-dependent 26S proteasome regulatory subunit